MTDDRLLRMRDVAAMVSLSAARIYQLIAAGKFPKQHYIGAASRWKQSEVQAWIAGLPQSRQEVSA